MTEKNNVPDWMQVGCTVAKERFSSAEDTEPTKLKVVKVFDDGVQTDDDMTWDLRGRPLGFQDEGAIWIVPWGRAHDEVDGLKHAIKAIKNLSDDLVYNPKPIAARVLAELREIEKLLLKCEQEDGP